MFTKNSLDLDMQCVLNTLNFECPDYSRRIQYDASHTLFINSDLRLKLFNTSNVNTFVYLRNIFPSSKTATVQWFDYKIYKGYTQEKLNSLIYSNAIGIRAILGQQLYKTNDMNILYFNQTSNTLTTKDGVDVYLNVTPVTDNPLMYYSKAVNTSWIYFITNCIGQFTLVPDFEKILYPAEGTKNCNALYSHFEIYGNESLSIVNSLFSRCSPSDTAVIHRPRYLFSYDDGVTYYKFNTADNTWSLQTPANASYFTYSEFLTKGNTYQEYLEITADDWNTLYDTDHRYRVLLNNYVSPVLIREKFWNDRLDLYDWAIYSNTTTTSMTSFMSGAM